MTKRYTVISVPTKDGPTYRIYDRINQCSIEGGFDTQKWAESVAEMMEEKYAELNHKSFNASFDQNEKLLQGLRKLVEAVREEAKANETTGPIAEGDQED